MRLLGAVVLAGLVGTMPGCRQYADTTPARPALPQVQAVLPAPTDCALDEGSLAAVEGSGLGLLERLRGGGGDTAAHATAAVLAGTLSTSVGDWERAYAFCGLVPATAVAGKREEAAVCQTKAAINMGRTRTACADLLAREWFADRSRVGLGFAADETPQP